MASSCKVFYTSGADDSFFEPRRVLGIFLGDFHRPDEELKAIMPERKNVMAKFTGFPLARTRYFRVDTQTVGGFPYLVCRVFRTGVEIRIGLSKLRDFSSVRSDNSRQMFSWKTDCGGQLLETSLLAGRGSRAGTVRVKFERMTRRGTVAANGEIEIDVTPQALSFERYLVVENAD